MVTGESVAVRLLAFHHGVGSGVGDGGAEHGKGGRVGRFTTGPGNLQNAGKAECDSGKTRYRQPFFEEQEGEQRGPNRRGELARKDFRQGYHSNGVKPAILSGEVEQVAPNLGARAFRSDMAPALIK